MIRYFYQLLDFLGSVFALLSPVTIIHWIIEATQEKSVLGLVQWLDPFYHPLNSIFEPFLRSVFGLVASISINPLLATLDNIATMYGQANLIPPELPYDISMSATGQVLPITQGLLGLVFTVAFFACSTGSQLLRALEQRLDTTKQQLLQKNRLQKLRQTEQKKAHQAITNKNIMVCILCDFYQNATTSSIAEQLYSRHQGIARDITPELMGIEFRSIQQALAFCTEAMQEIVKHYATLRPMDPQPPFRIGVHTHEKDDLPEVTLRYCQALAKYANDNQSALSENVKNMLDATKGSHEFTLSPLGSYFFEGIGAQDLFYLAMPKR